jgi:hypothetical protein
VLLRMTRSQRNILAHSCESTFTVVEVNLCVISDNQESIFLVLVDN